VGSASRDEQKRARAARRPVGRKSDQASESRQIDIDLEARVIRVRDSRIINTDQRAFCRRLLDEATRQPGVSKAEVDLPSATCRVEFAGAPATSLEMADVFAGCVYKAADGSPGAGCTPGLLPDGDWLTLTAYPLAGDVSLWATLEEKPGRIFVRHQGAAGSRDRLSRVAESLSHVDGVERCRATRLRRGLSVDFHEANGHAAWFVDLAERSFEELLAAEAPERVPTRLAAAGHGERAVALAAGPKRFMYLVLAGGAFAMTLIGLVVPGIPTVPFLLATSYCLARSSRRLNEMLTRSAFFGSIITEWGHHGGLSQTSKNKLIGLTAAIGLVAIVASALSPIVVIIVLLVSAFGIYKIHELPGLPDVQRAGIKNDPTARFALPAP
jgi:uncharacterized membrane protein YbaN (DUF454 family)